LADYVFKALKKHNLLTKLLSYTADNASNNYTLGKYLYKTMATLYDDWIDGHGLRDNRMRFKGQEAFI
jgi:hypothetical protein